MDFTTSMAPTFLNRPNHFLYFYMIEEAYRTFRLTEKTKVSFYLVIGAVFNTTILHLPSGFPGRINTATKICDIVFSLLDQ